MSSIALEHGQSHFRYGPELPFEEEFFSDPLDPTNGMRDTDGDGMPDYKEIHYTDYYPFIVNWANNQHRQNPKDFNATKYLKNQFNPFVRENIPPMLLSMSVTTVTEDVYTWVGCCGVGVNVWTGWNTYADIRARIYDVGGFSSVKISGPGGTVTFSSLHNGWYNTTIDVGFWEAATEYTIKLDAKDTAGNELKYDYTVKGLFAGVLDFLKDIWNAVTSIVKAAWEAVKSAVDFIVEFIKGIIQAAIDEVLSPIIQQYENWQNKLLEIINEATTEYESTGSISPTVLKSFSQLLSGGLFFGLLLTLSIAIIGVSIIANVMTAGGATAISYILAPLIVLAIVAVVSATGIQGTNIDTSGVEANVDSIFDFVKSLVLGQESSGSKNNIPVAMDTEPKEFIEIGAIMFKLEGFETSALFLGSLDFTGKVFESMGLVWSFIALLLGSIALSTSNSVLGILALSFATTATIVEFIAMPKTLDDSILPEIAALSCSGIGLTMAYYALFLK